MDDIVLIGAGGHCRSVLAAALRTGCRVRGILDLPIGVGKEIDGTPVIGTDQDIPTLCRQKCRFVLTLGMMGEAARRTEIFETIVACGGEMATIVASSAVVAPTASIGPGTVVLEQAVVNAGAAVGADCIINTAAVVEHDCRVGKGSHISTGAILNGAASVGEACLVGSHATIIQGVRICSGVTVGAASLVLQDIQEPGTYAGVPVRRLD